MTNFPWKLDIAVAVNIGCQEGAMLYISRPGVYMKESGAKHSMPNLDSGKGDLLHGGATLLRAGNFR